MNPAFAFGYGVAGRMGILFVPPAFLILSIMFILSKYLCSPSYSNE